MFDENKLKNHKVVIIWMLISLGTMLRFFMMAFGNNFDFDSYGIVGEIVSRGGNVYAETSRYNYGFIFFLIQGIGYKLACFLNENMAYWFFRIFIVSVLTLADLGIAGWISNKYSTKLGILFFLNPLSIIITGYHNQFDNIAILFALLSIDYIDDSKNITKKDIIALILLTLSLLTKHILFVFFIWLFFQKNNHGLLKKFIYVCAPMGLFVLSFIPFAIGNQDAFSGILNNVFFYRSYNNYPLLRFILSSIQIPNNYYFIIYVLIMVIVGFILRKKNTELLLLLYFLSMVAFSSAIANQYLIIPIVMLVTYNKKIWYWLYEIIGLVYCILNTNELNYSQRLVDSFPNLKYVIFFLGEEGGITISLMALILCIVVCTIIYNDYKINKKNNKEENSSVK